MLRSKSHVFAAGLILALLAGSVLAWAPQQSPGNSPTQTPPQSRPDRGPGGERGPGPGGRQGATVNVEGAMKIMNRALRQLKAQITDASKKDENLSLVNEMQRGCVIAKGQLPPADVLEHAKDDAGKIAMKEAYRRDLRKALRILVDIESDLVDNKTDAAKAALDSLIKLRMDSHEAMDVKDED